MSNEAFHELGRFIKAEAPALYRRLAQVPQREMRPHLNAAIPGIDLKPYELVEASAPRIKAAIKAMKALGNEPK